MTTPLEKIRAACIAANPSIMDLKFGCEIQSKSNATNWVGIRGVILKKTHNAYWFHSLNDKLDRPTIVDADTILEEMEILGRPIRLADVLVMTRDLPAHKHPGNNLIGVDGSFWKWSNADLPPEYTGSHKWNLLDDDLSHQSEETLQFIASLL